MSDSQTSTPAPYRIVVGADFTDTGDVALHEAMRIARQFPDSELHLVYALDENAGEEAERVDVLSDHMEEAAQRLRKHAIAHSGKSLRDRKWEQHTTLHVELGAAAKALQQVAVDVDADLIVVGTHGRKGVEKFVLGSVADALLKIAHLPVLVARPKNFEGLEKSATVEAARPGQPTGGGHAVSERIMFGGRTSTHISGLV